MSAQELKESETDFGLPKGFLKFIAFACNVCYDDFFRRHLFALALFTISLGTTLIPRRNKKTKVMQSFFFRGNKVRYAPCTYPVIKVTVGNK